jgi:RNA polymerase sigma-70 factor (ECF subfamily)
MCIRDRNLVEYNLPDEVDVEVVEDEISLEFLLGIVQELPERYRMVFNLYVLDGFSHKEISKLLGIAEGTSKSNLSRARLILKEKVELSQQKRNAGLF